MHLPRSALRLVLMVCLSHRIGVMVEALAVILTAIFVTDFLLNKLEFMAIILNILCNFLAY